MKTSAPAPEDFNDEPNEVGGVGLGGATAGTPTGPAAMTATDAGAPARAAPGMTPVVRRRGGTRALPIARMRDS